MASIYKNANLDLVADRIESGISPLQEDIKEINDKIQEYAETQSSINNLQYDLIHGLQQEVTDNNKLFNLSLGLAQVKYNQLDNLKQETKQLEKDCNIFKKNILLGFIGSGIIDIILCLMILMQMY